MLKVKKSAMKYKDPQDGAMKDVGIVVGGDQVEVPTKTSELENDSNYATQEFVNEQDREMTQQIAEISVVANEANTIAKGASKSLVYGDYQTMITMLNALGNDALMVGWNLLIITLNVPDLWVSNISEESAEYTYVSDEQFVTDLEDGTVQVGYYMLSPLETQKVNLTDYVKNTDHATNSSFGLVRGNANFGATIEDGTIFVKRAVEEDIDKKNSAYKAITPSKLDYAVMKALTDPLNHEWSDEEKQSARDFFGVTDLFETYEDEVITKPTSAKVGQMLVVKSVDENGVPTEWEVTDVASGGSGGSDWKLLDTFDFSSGALSYAVDTSGCKEIMAITVSALTTSGTYFDWKKRTYAASIKPMYSILHLWYLGDGFIAVSVPRGGTDTLLKSHILIDASETDNDFVITCATASAGTVKVYGR